MPNDVGMLCAYSVQGDKKILCNMGMNQVKPLLRLPDSEMLMGVMLLQSKHNLHPD
jgi:hypothetical protein